MPIRKNELTAKEQKFVHAYIVKLDAQAAGKAAKYAHPDKTAYKVLARPHVQAAIRKAKDRQAERLESKADDVIRELVKLGSSNMKNYIRITADGEPAVDLSYLTEDQFAAVSEVQVEDFVDGRGEDARDVRRIKFKLHDKRGALCDLGKHFGIFAEDNSQRIPSTEDVAKALEDMTPADAALEWSKIRDNV